MQKLLKANLTEQTGTEKKGNLEKKLYRATAAWYTPQQIFNFKPKDPNLKSAFEIYGEIQGSMMARMSAYIEIPKDADPIDYSIYVNMQVFADICGKPDVQAKIVDLEDKLAKFKAQGGYIEKHKA